MKRTLLELSATASMLCLFLAACSEIDTSENPYSGNEDQNPVEVTDGDMPVIFNCSIIAPDDTRTEFHDNTIWWSEGDSLNIYQNYISKVGGNYSTGYVSRRIAGLSETFSSTVNFTTPAEYPAFYWALFPKQSVITPKTTFSGESTLYTCMNVPAVQNPSPESFDPAADVLISEYITSQSKQTSFNLRFRRVVALGKMTIKNLPSSESITSVKIENKKHYVAGAGYYGLEDGSTRNGVKSGTGSYSITMNYDEPVTADSPTGMTAYFTSRAFTLTENNSFTVTVTTADGYRYTKEVTVPEGREIAFEEDKGTKFNVDMSSVERSECEAIKLAQSATANTVSDIYFTISKPSDYSGTITSVKYKAVAKDDYDPAVNYIDGSSTIFPNIESLNSGTTYKISFSNLVPDKEYVAVVQCETGDGHTYQVTRTGRTDWFQIKAVTRSAGGIQIQFKGKGLDPNTTKNYRVADYDVLPASESDYESFYTEQLKPGASPATVNSINSADGVYAVGVTKYYTDNTTQTAMVSGKTYTVMMKVFNTRGEYKFVHSSAVAK